MANKNVRKTYSVVQGGGRVYVGPPSYPVHGQYFADDDAVNDAIADAEQGRLLGDLSRSPLDDTGPVNSTGTSRWSDAGYLDDQGVSLTIGNEMEVITEIESLWPIDARKVSAGAMFRAMLLEATLDNLYTLGLSKVGLGFEEVTTDKLVADSKVVGTEMQKLDMFSADRFGGPNEHIPGVGIVFDGPAPAADPAANVDDYLRARRVFLPRVINITPIDLIAAKRGQTMIRVDLTVLMPDNPVFRPCYIVDQSVNP